MERKILNSWKEIASYMGRGIRTVQRWEHDFRLPVHRPSGHERSTVIAFEDEIDQWFASTPVRNSKQAARQQERPAPRTRRLAQSVRSSALNLVRSAEKLQSSLLRLQEQQHRRQQGRRQQPA